MLFKFFPMNTSESNKLLLILFRLCLKCSCKRVIFYVQQNGKSRLLIKLMDLISQHLFFFSLSIHFHLYFYSVLLFTVTNGLQRFSEQPKYTEVNPNQDTLLVCKVIDRRGTCSWQKVCYFM